MKKTKKYCPFCGNDLGEEVYSKKYVENLQKYIKHLEDLKVNLLGAEYLTDKDIEDLLKGWLKSCGSKSTLHRRVELL